ncbi:hypothetical protein PENSPDRAFT_752463, partial [Peniophora sp. CONT]
RVRVPRWATFFWLVRGFLLAPTRPRGSRLGRARRSVLLLHLHPPRAIATHIAIRRTHHVRRRIILYQKAQDVYSGCAGADIQRRCGDPRRRHYERDPQDITPEPACKGRREGALSQDRGRCLSRSREHRTRRGCCCYIARERCARRGWCCRGEGRNRGC